ncbi:MAG: response regulator [Lachnospiraceae bacterium]|nr:response regulator [Lachnospiraceae bacterium]
MSKIKISSKDIINRSDIKKIIFSIEVAVLFIAIFIVYVLRLYSSTRERIITEGKINAVENATIFDDCLAPGLSALKIASQVVENDLKRGADNKEILDNLVAGTETIMESLVTNTTGLYAYVNGEYLDGAYWVPDEDYIPTERPWYVQATKNPGAITMVEPYLDEMSGTVIITMAKCLKDEKTVVALDLFMDGIQETTEKISDSDELTIMVLCSHGTVITHSDRNELGKNYETQESGLGTLIADNIYNKHKEYFELHYQGEDYIVYAVPIQNGWYSVSLMDSDRAYRPLKILVIITGLISIAVVAVLAGILIKSVRQDLIANRLDKMLSSTADIYMSLCDLDLEHNSVTEIKNVNPAVSQAIAKCGNNMREEFKKIMMALPESPTKKTAIEFSDLSNISERIGESNVPTTEYISFGNIWVRARFVVSERNENGEITHLLWMIENIDKEKKDREKLVDMSERAIAASEAKSAFLSNMSHEIRTPITAILGMNEMITRECGDEVILGYADNIKNAGNTLLGIINDILDFSKIEAGKMEIIPAEYKPAFTLKNLVNMICDRAEAKGLKFITEFDTKIPSVLYGDEVRIKQIIINILTNAVKYTEKGEIKFCVGCSCIDGDPDSTLLHVVVKDTGIGIKKEDISRLFDEFERIDEKRNRGIEGTGLGMSITRSLLHMMGSKLEVQSVYGKGSIFSFYLKQKIVNREPGDYSKASSVDPDSGRDYKEKFIAPGAKVLIIDDNAVNLVVFTSLLKQTRVNVDTAESGEKGIELSAKTKYDIIFLDHMMPGMDGIDTLEAMKKSDEDKNHDTPVICLTANAISGAKEKYLEAGFDDYLTKPIDPDRLEEMMMQYLPSEKVEIQN